MRSRPDRPHFALVVALAVLASAPALPDAAAARPATRAEIEHALEVTKADPNLALEKKTKVLVWNSNPKPARKPRHSDSNWQWLADLFHWLADTSAVLMWIVLAGLAALLAVFIVRVVSKNRLPERGRRFIAPTHVQDLDIRPESLPPDIGAAARALWDRGEQRAALALLYRGLLSRLAHVHEIPIRDSSTEGDCLTLAARTLDAARVDYVTLLVRTRQRAIYGGLTPDAAQIWDLCARFAANLDGPAPGEPAKSTPLASA